MKVVVSEVLRSFKSGTQVRLSNGAKAFLPAAKAVKGFEMEDSDLTISSVSATMLVDVSLVPKKREIKPIVETRDMTNFNVKEELNLIQACLLRKRALLGDQFVTANLPDLVDEVFTYFWKTKFFQTYDEKKSFGYSSYIATGVERWMINVVRDGNFRMHQFTDSLDFKFKDDEENSSTLQDTISDTREDPHMDFETLELYKFMEKTSISFGETDIIPGLFYVDLFYELTANNPIPAFARNHGFSYRKINLVVAEFQKKLAAALKENYGEEILGKAARALLAA